MHGTRTLRLLAAALLLAGAGSVHGQEIEAEVDDLDVGDERKEGEAGVHVAVSEKVLVIGTDIVAVYGVLGYAAILVALAGDLVPAV